jgi:hypothetical protein
MVGSITASHAYIVVMMFAGAINAKGLAATLAGCLGMVLAQGNTDAQTFIFLFYIPAYILSVTRG